MGWARIIKWGKGSRCLTHVYVKALVKGPKGSREVPELLVDTGATFTVLPVDILREVGASLQPVKKKLELGDGRYVEADTYSVVLAVQDREDVTFAVTFKDAKPVLGVRSLEDLGFKVDPVAGSLEPTRPPGSAFYYRARGLRETGPTIQDSPSASLERFQKKIRGRLKTWKEEDHEADRR